MTIMQKPQWLLFKIWLIVAICTLAAWAVLPANAQEPDDGRINKVPWVNSWGAVAVYCVDGSGQPGGTFAGGGIKILNSGGRQVFFAPAATVNAAIARANQRNAPAIVRTQSVYTVTALPGSYLKLTSRPDAEGKTFLGEWKDCAAVASEATPEPGASVCVPRFIRNEADSGFRCDYCYNGIDDDCNGKTDAADFACQYYCGR
jgi:hypothetical protein